VSFPNAQGINPLVAASDDDNAVGFVPIVDPALMYASGTAEAASNE
jgi:hypothetical protein